MKIFSTCITETEIIYSISNFVVNFMIKLVKFDRNNLNILINNGLN